MEQNITDIIDIIDITKLLVATNLVKSRSEARRLIKQGAITINDIKATTHLGVYFGSYIVPLCEDQVKRLKDD